MKAFFVATLRLNYVFDDPDDVYWAWEKLFVEAWMTMLQLNGFHEDIAINLQINLQILNYGKW